MTSLQGNAPGQRGAETAKKTNYEKDYSIPSAASQRATLRKHLQVHKKLNTLTAREKLGIMHPAMRVLGLKKSGLDIEIDWVYATDATGVRHRVAQYHMLPERQGRLF